MSSWLCVSQPTPKCKKQKVICSHFVAHFKNNMNVMLVSSFSNSLFAICIFAYWTRFQYWFCVILSDISDIGVFIEFYKQFLRASAPLVKHLITENQMLKISLISNKSLVKQCWMQDKSEEFNFPSYYSWKVYKQICLPQRIV